MSTSFDTEAVKEHLEDFHDSLDDLHEALAPLRTNATDTSLSAYIDREKLNSIGKAKLFVTLAYSIDSLLFCHLKAMGTITETHTIMNELERIKQYVGKIKEATAHQKRNATLDKNAANRMIGHNLAGNAAHDRDRAIKTAQTNARIQEKLADLSEAANIGKHTRFGNSGISSAAQERIVPGQENVEDGLSVNDGPLKDVATEGAVDTNESSTANSSTSKLTTEPSMFEETKAEKKNRERRERKSAKKDRQRKLKEKQVAKDQTTALLSDGHALDLA